MTGFARLALTALLAIAAGGIARADDVLKARIGVLRLSSSAPVFIAQDKGYFREAGLDIELKFFDARNRSRWRPLRATSISASPRLRLVSIISQARAR
jgi:ABC-type nitrate/sulfonate/bicarbonate transport system substrate-binding protein